MIQDIEPYRLDSGYLDIGPEEQDRILCFHGDRIVARLNAGRLLFPTGKDMVGTQCPRMVYAFQAAGQRFFLSLEEPEIPADCSVFSLRELRTIRLQGNLDIFIVYTAYHLWKWYDTSRFCGRCGGRTEIAHDERAMICPACGNRVYPRINSAVIVGVKNHDRLLITRYKGNHAMNALVAGFTEIGETAEQTVSREVMEEVGLRVKNIRYYKSQPWGIAADLLTGFYCEVDGDDTIHLDSRELGYAEWVSRKEIVLQPSDHSLTNEMMKMFRDGKEL